MQALVCSTVSLYSNKRVKVNISMALIFYYMTYLLKRTVSNCKLVSLALKDLMCNLYFKALLILLLLEAGDIEMNPGPKTINNSLSILRSNFYFTQQY